MNQLRFEPAAKHVGDIDELIVDAYNKLLEENHYLKSTISSLVAKELVPAPEKTEFPDRVSKPAKRED